MPIPVLIILEAAAAGLIGHSAHSAAIGFGLLVGLVGTTLFLIHVAAGRAAVADPGGQAD